MLKKGFAGSVTNYRPVSLTSVISKLMEHVISRKITEYLKLLVKVSYVMLSMVFLKDVTLAQEY